MAYTLEEQAAHRAAWVEALRSGAFKQGRYALTRRNPDGTENHCCLGVACKLAVEAGVIDSWAVGNGGHAVIYGKQNLEPVYVNRSETGLPIQVQEWLGVPTQSGEMRDRRKSDLTQLNDEKHYTFNKIAEVIEAGDLLLEGDSREF